MSNISTVARFSSGTNTSNSWAVSETQAQSTIVESREPMVKMWATLLKAPRIAGRPFAKTSYTRQPQAQEHVPQFLHPRATEESAQPLDDWLEKAHALRMELRAQYGEEFVFDSLSVLDEVREERLNGLMGGG
jgi:hypothetical protein